MSQRIELSNKKVVIKAKANEKYLLVDESGKSPSKIKMVKKDGILEIIEEGKDEPSVIIEDYYVVNNCKVVGIDSSTNEEIGYILNDEWSYLTLTDTELGFFATPLGIGAGIVGAGGIAVAASNKGGSSDEGSSSNNSSKIITATTVSEVVVPDNYIEGTVTLGPVLGAGRLTVNLYDVKGTLLGSGDVDGNGKYSVNIKKYSGVILAQLVDKDATQVDYKDEATGLDKNLSTNLLAFSSISDSKTTVNINPLTTIASNLAGVMSADGVMNISSFNPNSTANNDVSNSFGLGNNDITKQTAILTIDVIGAKQTPNNLGVVLAALSGMDASRGVYDTIYDLYSDIKTNGEIKSQLKSLFDGVAIADTKQSGVAGGTVGLVDKLSNLLAAISSTNELLYISSISTNNIIDAIESIQPSSLVGRAPMGTISVLVKLDNATAVAATINSDGTWSLNIPAFFLETVGTHKYSVIATLADGTTATASRLFVVNASDNPSPVVQSFTVTDAVGTTTLGKGAESVGFIVTISEPVTSTGTLTAHFSVNGQDVIATSVAVTNSNTIIFVGTIPSIGNGTTISLTSLVSDSGTIIGQLSNQVMVAPTSGAKTYSEYTVDNTAPITGTLNLLNYVDVGISPSDKISIDSSFDLAISGQESSSSVVYQLSINSGILWSDTTSTQTSLSDGVYKFRAIVTDSAGNSSTTPVIDVTVDTTSSVNISGIAREGKLLSATNILSDMDGLSVISYQWQSSIDGVIWSNISSATTNSYVLTQNEVDKQVRVTVSYIDTNGLNYSASSTPSAIVTLNHLPTLSNGLLLTGFNEDTFKEITYTDLITAADEADLDGDTLSFRIETLTSGTLQKWNILTNSWDTVTSENTFISSGEKIQWKGDLNASGELNAFSIRAWDGVSLSSTSVQVRTEVLPINDAVSTMTLSSLSKNINETDFTERMLLSDIIIVDDNLGENTLVLSGVDKDIFELDGARLYLKSGILLNYEDKNSYEVIINAEDSSVIGSSIINSTFTLNVNNVNEAPSIVLNNTLSTVAEVPYQTNFSKTSSDIKVADIIISDDVLGTNSISLSGTNANIFKVLDNALYLKSGTTLDYEATNQVHTFFVKVSVADASLSTSEPVTVDYSFTMTDTNDFPYIGFSNKLSTLAENTSTISRTKVADITIFDDAININNQVYLSGGDLSSFEIKNNALYLKAGVQLDYALKNSYSVTATVLDATITSGRNSWNATYTLSLTDVNDAPTAVVLQNTTSSLAESTRTDTQIKVADIAVIDDTTGTNTIYLSDTDAMYFEVIGTVLYLKAGVTLDYETKSQLQVTVSVIDSSVAEVPVTTNYTLNIADVVENTNPTNQAPTSVFLTNVTSTLAENTVTKSRVKVGEISIVDDGLGANMVSLSGADAKYFETVWDSSLDKYVLYLKSGTALSSQTVAITDGLDASKTLFSIEGKSQYSLNINVQDAWFNPSTAVSSAFNLNIVALDINLERSTVLERLRLADMNSMIGNIRDTQNGTYSNWVKYLMGDIDETAYLLARQTAVYKSYYPLLSMNDDKSINWASILDAGTDYSAASYGSNRYLFGTLVAAYYYTREERYMDRYLQIMNDLFTNAKSTLFSNLTLSKRKNFLLETSTGDNGSLLGIGFLLEATYEYLGVLAKYIGDTSQLRQYYNDTFLSSKTIPLTQTQLNMVSASDLYNIGKNFFTQYANDLYKYYVLEPRGTADQQLIALTGLLKMQSLYAELPEAKAYGDLISQNFVLKMKNLYLKDGGLSEPSLNYNFSNVRDLEKLTKEMPNESWTEFAKKAVEDFYTFADAIRTPLGNLPQIGKSTWEVGVGVSSSTHQFSDLNQLFPYSGAAVQRSDWSSDAGYMFMFSSHAPGGHTMVAGNALQMGAYGKILLSSGGHNYSSSVSSHAQAGPYTDENSSWMHNTIVVDNKSQNVPSGTTKALINTRWLSGDAFDYMETKHESGYGTVHDVTHLRKVVFLADIKTWIMVDIIDATQQHNYTEIWKFAPLVESSGNRISGFKATEVATDGINETIVAANGLSSSSVNLAIEQFSLADISYDKYWGGDGGAYGYFGSSSLSYGVDVHAKFSGLNSSNHLGDNIVISILRPFLGTDASADGMTAVNRNDSNNGLAGVDLTFDSGRTVSVRASLDLGTLSAGGINLSDIDLLVVDSGNGSSDQRYMVTGDDEKANSSYENWASNTNYFIEPTDFSWTEDPLNGVLTANLTNAVI